MLVSRARRRRSPRRTKTSAPQSGVDPVPACESRRSPPTHPGTDARMRIGHRPSRTGRRHPRELHSDVPPDRLSHFARTGACDRRWRPRSDRLRRGRWSVRRSPEVAISPTYHYERLPAGSRTHGARQPRRSTSHPIPLAGTLPPSRSTTTGPSSRPRWTTPRPQPGWVGFQPAQVVQCSAGAETAEARGALVSVGGARCAVLRCQSVRRRQRSSAGY
jgi:hypothetical protein